MERDEKASSTLHTLGAEAEYKLGNAFCPITNAGGTVKGQFVL